MGRFSYFSQQSPLLEKVIRLSSKLIKFEISHRMDSSPVVLVLNSALDQGLDSTALDLITLYVKV